MEAPAPKKRGRPRKKSHELKADVQSNFGDNEDAIRMLAGFALDGGQESVGKPKGDSGHEDESAAKGRGGKKEKSTTKRAERAVVRHVDDKGMKNCDGCTEQKHKSLFQKYSGKCTDCYNNDRSFSNLKASQNRVDFFNEEEAKHPKRVEALKKKYIADATFEIQVKIRDKMT